MPIPTPFHPRTSELCTSLRWKEWAGYHAVCSFDTSHEREYFAFRQAAGLIDVSPLFKYDVTGRDAEAFLSRLTVKNIATLKEGRVTYLCWCDDDGKIVDDGTVTRFSQDHFRVTAAEPSISWFWRHARGYDIAIRDMSTELGALALQGPTSREILVACAGSALAELKFFRHTQASIDGVTVDITRTGYTGDLGYEVWVPARDALKVWDAIMEAGKNYRIQPAALDAMDVTRVEAGFIMNGVDYWSANHCVIDSRKSTPYELGLGWTVNLDRDPFIGQAALKAEKDKGPEWALVGLVYDWDEYEVLFDQYGLPPQVPSGAWRTPVPVYAERNRQVGFATSGAFSPILKQNLALASIKSKWATAGTKLKVEVTAEFERRAVTATVAAPPFFNPERKRK